MVAVFAAPAVVSRSNVSLAAGALCQWVHAMKIYAEIYREVEPKRTEDVTDVFCFPFCRIYSNIDACRYVYMEHPGISGPWLSMAMLVKHQEQASPSSREAGVEAEAVARSEC